MTASNRESFPTRSTRVKRKDPRRSAQDTTKSVATSCRPSRAGERLRLAMAVPM